MNERKATIWSRPWHGPGKLLAGFGLLVAGSFVILSLIAIAVIPNPETGPLLLSALAVSILLGAFVIGGFLFFSSPSCWRNLRRLIFAVACLVTLIALAYAEEDFRGKRAWRQYRRAVEAQGQKLGVVAVAPPPIPDEKNFALMPLLRPLFDFTQGTGGLHWNDTNGMARVQNLSADLRPSGRTTNDHVVLGNLEKGTFADLAACAAFYHGNTNYPQAPEGAAPATVILTALGRFDAELKELQEAAASRPECRFPIPWQTEPSWAILLPHLAPIKALTVLTSARATAELEAGRAADAFEDLKLGLRFSDGIRDEPLLIDHLVRLATLGVDLQTLREGLLRHAWTEAQLSTVERHLGSINLLAEYQCAIRGERALSTSGLDYLRRQGWRNNPLDYLELNPGESRHDVPLNFIPRGWYYQNMVRLSRFLDAFTLPAADPSAFRVFPEVTEKGSRAAESMRAGPYTVFAKILVPAVQNAVRKTARMQSWVDEARVACALERYRLATGKLPDNLEALAPRFLDRVPYDIMDGKPLRYQLGPDGGYVLYSVGWDKKDDGGQPELGQEKKEPGVEGRRGDWVWELGRG